MNSLLRGLKGLANRRSFIKQGLATSSAVAGAAGLLVGGSVLLGDDDNNNNNSQLSQGDAAILRFLAAAEILESDLWVQYNELGGIQDSEVPGITGGSPPYIAALSVLDGDMSQYIHDNTEDEISHFSFINAYLSSKGAATVSLDQFKTLPSSKATGARQIGRLTNLMQLTVDTSWWDSIPQWRKQSRSRSRVRVSASSPCLEPWTISGNSSQ